MPHSLFCFSDVINPFLKAYKDFNLCPQIVQLHEQQIENLTLVPVENIQFKCVFMACQRNRKLLSIPPNMLEHNWIVLLKSTVLQYLCYYRCSGHDPVKKKEQSEVYTIYMYL